MGDPCRALRPCFGLHAARVRNWFLPIASWSWQRTYVTFWELHWRESHFYVSYPRSSIPHGHFPHRPQHHLEPAMPSPKSPGRAPDYSPSTPFPLSSGFKDILMEQKILLLATSAILSLSSLLVRPLRKQSLDKITPTPPKIHHQRNPWHPPLTALVLYHQWKHWSRHRRFLHLDLCGLLITTVNPLILKVMPLRPRFLHLCVRQRAKPQRSPNPNKARSPAQRVQPLLKQSWRLPRIQV